MSKTHRLNEYSSLTAVDMQDTFNLDRTMWGAWEMNGDLDGTYVLTPGGQKRFLIWKVREALERIAKRDALAKKNLQNS